MPEALKDEGPSLVSEVEKVGMAGALGGAAFLAPAFGGALTLAGCEASSSARRRSRSALRAVVCEESEVRPEDKGRCRVEKEDEGRTASGFCGFSLGLLCGLALCALPPLFRLLLLLLLGDLCLLALLLLLLAGLWAGASACVEGQEVGRVAHLCGGGLCVLLWLQDARVGEEERGRRKKEEEEEGSASTGWNGVGPRVDALP